MLVRGAERVAAPRIHEGFDVLRRRFQREVAACAEYKIRVRTHCLQQYGLDVADDPAVKRYVDVLEAFAFLDKETIIGDCDRAFLAVQDYGQKTGGI